MAFQPTSSCSPSPYKCLHLISSELYNNLLKKNERCDSENIASSNASPSIQNNFYPGSSGYNSHDGDNGGPGPGAPNILDIEPQPSHIPPQRIAPPDPDGNDVNQYNNTHPPPPPPPAPHIQETTNVTTIAPNTASTPSHDIINNPANVNDVDMNSIEDKPPFTVNFRDRLKKLKKPKRRGGPYKNASKTDPESAARKGPNKNNNNNDDVEMGLVDGNNTSNINVRDDLHKQNLRQDLTNIQQANSINVRSDILKNPDVHILEKNIQQAQTPHRAHIPHPPLAPYPPAGHVPPPAPYPPSTKVQSPSSEYFEEDNKSKFYPKSDPPIWDPTNNSQRFVRQNRDVKQKTKEKVKNSIPKKREFKFERNIKDDDEDHQHDNDVAMVDASAPSAPTSSSGVGSCSSSLRCNSCSTCKGARPKDDTDLRRDVLKRNFQKKIGVRKDIFKKDPDVLRKIPSSELFQGENTSEKKSTKKPQTPIPKKIITQNSREKKEAEVAQIIKDFFVNHKYPPKLKKALSSASGEYYEPMDTAESKIEVKHKIPKAPKLKKALSSTSGEYYEPMDMVESKIEDKHKTPKEEGGSTEKHQIKKETKRLKTRKDFIENNSDTNLSHKIKKEMIGEEMIKREKNKKPIVSTKHNQGEKRKNKFGTHPTGPIKFAKKSHKKGGVKLKKEKHSDDENDKAGNKRLKKFYGSGFRMWKI